MGPTAVKPSQMLVTLFAPHRALSKPAKGSAFRRARAGTTADHRRPDRPSRACPTDRPRRASMAPRQALRAPERKSGLDQATGDPRVEDEVAHRHQHVLAARDGLLARTPSSSVQGDRRQPVDADPARRVLRRRIAQAVATLRRGALRTRVERSVDRVPGVRRRPGPDRPARPEQRRRHARHSGLSRLRATEHLRHAMAGKAHRPGRSGNDHAVTALGLTFRHPRG